MSGADFAALLPDVARRLLGDSATRHGCRMALRLARLAVGAPGARHLA